MSKNNDVFQVLVVSDTGKTILTAGNELSDLNPGGIGVFNANTNLSVDGTDLTTAREIYLAVGVDRDADGTIEDVNKSSGIIQVPNIVAYTIKCYQAAQSQIVDITGFKAKCDTEYLVKVGIRNQAAYYNYGFNYPFKSFVVHTSCCEESCGGCPEGDCTELADKIVTAINEDPEAIMTAIPFGNRGSLAITGAPDADGNITVEVGTETYTVAILDADDEAGVATKVAAAIMANADSKYVAYVSTATVYILAKVPTSDAGDVVTFTDTDTTGATATESNLAYYPLAATGTSAFAAAYPGACLGVRITASPIAVETYCKVNLKYEFPRSTALDVVLGTGFECNGTVETIQELAFEEGSGYDIARQEYLAGGWNGKPGPYSQSELVGESIGNHETFAVKTGKYTQINITSEQVSNAGWGTYQNRVSTLIAVPCDNPDILGDLITVLNRIVSAGTPKFPALSTCSTCAEEEG